MSHDIQDIPRYVTELAKASKAASLPLGRALFTPRPPAYRLKAVLKSLSGSHYCRLLARIRQALRL